MAKKKHGRKYWDLEDALAGVDFTGNNPSTPLEPLEDIDGSGNYRNRRRKTSSTVISYDKNSVKEYRDGFSVKQEPPKKSGGFLGSLFNRQSNIKTTEIPPDYDAEAEHSRTLDKRKNGLTASARGKVKSGHGRITGDASFGHSGYNDA